MLSAAIFAVVALLLAALAWTAIRDHKCDHREIIAGDLVAVRNWRIARGQRCKLDVPGTPGAA